MTIRSRIIRYVITIIAGLAFASQVYAEQYVIPDVHSGIQFDDNRDMFYILDGDTLSLAEPDSKYTLDKMRSMPTGTDDGLEFDFGIPDFEGTLYYGLINPPSVQKYAYPAFKRSAKIDSGKVSIDIAKRLSGLYDFIGWKETGVVRLGYRIADSHGRMLYDGKLMLSGTGPFEVDTSIIEGPFINMITNESAVVSFTTNFETISAVDINGMNFDDPQPGLYHELELTGLDPDTEYIYTVKYGQHSDDYSFRTAPEPGTRTQFMFAYASDSRGSTGGGERNLQGTNSYIGKKIAALCKYKDARFLQFTGDLIDGYAISVGEIELEYANWKRTVEPFAAYIPFIPGMGNHENLLHYFTDGEHGVGIDMFPFASQSSEAVFAENFVNPHNGPSSEDGSQYDPNPSKIDFPPYDETAFFYTYDNVAMIVLNSNYWFSYSIKRAPRIGGNLHGYLMDNQIEWLKMTLQTLESDDNIDHVFVTCHTPIFPNGGHVSDDMWYDGSNEPRPTIAGKLVEKGIIERRDELLDLLMNRSTKVKATLTGDEHNYSLLRVTKDIPIYPDDYDKPKLTEFSPFWHINNGAAGAPYYGREVTPWMDYVETFSTQNALVFFHVDGDSVHVEVINPDTFEQIDEFDL